MSTPVSGSNPNSKTGNESRFLPGALLAGRYRIVALLGHGGMGEVYRADDLTLGQQVALKFLPEAVAGNADALTRFRNEVRVARQVSHPNVCRMYDVGEVEGHVFLSMEYVDGEDLGSLLRRIGRLPADKALEIARRLCAGLAAAHEKGVLHRDLKPANVMLDGRGQVLLTDFGLAGLAGQIEGAEVRNGTPAYMAPEQLAGDGVTAKSDIYSLGLVLYEIFTGKRPFESDTLAGLMRARKESTPVNPTTLVRDMDPAVERVILRCLESSPAYRPPSALAVAAALPGGDPLAAALAAGETPSPQMVAAAGEGTALAPRIAVPLLIATIAGLLATAWLANRSSAIEKIRPEYSPEVLSQKARDIIQRLGYPGDPADDALGFSWDGGLLNYIRTHDKLPPAWDTVLRQRPPLLRFWYRQSNYPLGAVEFHNDLLTPGMVEPDDPPPIVSGMIQVDLDAQGRLLYFEAIPPQLRESAKQSATAVDWGPLFAAAALEPAKLKAAEPAWTFLGASDARMAWTGVWPGTSRPLRVEAAAFQGKPVAFSLIGPWTKPDRMPPLGSTVQQEATFIILIVLALVFCIGAPLLARRNLLQGRGDRRGALRLGFFIFCAQMAVWLCRGHFAATMGTFGDFLIAIVTSVFYGVLIWAVYLAIEPYVRRHWPRTLISWTSVLTGRVRDPIVGRDVLFGIALGASWVLIIELLDLVLQRSRAVLQLGSEYILTDARSALGMWLLRIPYSVRAALMIFFLLFLLKVLLRNQWLAGAAYALIFTVLTVLRSDTPLVDGLETFLIECIVVVAVLRFGLLALTVAAFFADGLMTSIPPTMHVSAWYFGGSVAMLASAIVLAVWAFYTSLAGQKLWKGDPFG